MGYNDDGREAATKLTLCKVISTEYCGPFKNMKGTYQRKLLNLLSTGNRKRCRLAEAIVEARDFVACQGVTETAQLVETAELEVLDLIQFSISALEVAEEVANEVAHAAEDVLSPVRGAGKALETVAIKQLILGQLGYEAKHTAPDITRAAGSGTLKLAQAGVKLKDEVIQVACQIARWVTKFFTSLVDVTTRESKGYLRCFNNSPMMLQQFMSLIGSDKVIWFMGISCGVACRKKILKDNRMA
jgi:hypothetical protein